MKARILSVLIICALMLEGCAVISKSDYTVLSGVHHETDTKDSDVYTTGVPSLHGISSGIEPSDIPTLLAENDPNNIEGQGTDTPDTPDTPDTSSSETISDVSDSPDDPDTGIAPGVLEDPAETSAGNVDTPEAEDTQGTQTTPTGDDPADTAAAGNTGSDLEKSENNKAGTDHDSEKATPAPTKFPKDTSDKSYRKEEDIIIPASQIDNYTQDFDLLAPSSTMSFNELVGDNCDYELPKGFPKPGTYKIIVDLYHQVVMAYSKDENEEYTVPVRYMLCSSGVSSSPTRTGVFKLKSYRVRFGLFNNTSVYAQYWSQIDGRMYFHSILYTDRKAETYNTSFNNLGNRASHGCIRLSVPDARWIWYNAAPGTTVVVRKGSSDDVVTARIKELLKLDKMPSERIGKMSGDAVPYTDNWTIDSVPHEVDFIQGSQEDS